MRFYTYLYRDIDGTPIYVGKGTKKRAWGHFKGDTQLSRLLKKRFRDGFKIEQTLSPLMSDEKALLQEIELILKYGRVDKGTGTLFNKTDGGESTKGWIPSEENKKNISDSLRNNKICIGRILPAESYTKQSETMKNKPKFKCIHCNILCDAGNFKRSHGDNCRFKGK